MAAQRDTWFEELGGGAFGRMLDFLAWLSKNNVVYQLYHSRENAIMIMYATKPDTRFEVEFISDGTLAIEVFRSTGDMTTISLTGRQLFSQRSTVN